MAARDLCFTPAVELSRLYRSRRVSPLEVMEAVLARIDAVNPDGAALGRSRPGGRSMIAPSATRTRARAR
jgi:Asp-tRNA(Asn)/Glu-tRNA(Gln) amidotransferase A subunit family amidase